MLWILPRARRSKQKVTDITATFTVTENEEKHMACTQGRSFNVDVAFRSSQICSCLMRQLIVLLRPVGLVCWDIFPCVEVSSGEAPLFRCIIVVSLSKQVMWQYYSPPFTRSVVCPFTVRHKILLRSETGYAIYDVRMSSRLYIETALQHTKLHSRSLLRRDMR